MGDVPESELWDISYFEDFRVRLKNGNVDNVVEFVRKWDIKSQYVKVDLFNCGNETGLSRVVSRAQNYAVIMFQS